LEIQLIEKIIESLAEVFLDAVKWKMTHEDFLNSFQGNLDVANLVVIWDGIQNEFNYLEDLLSKLNVDYSKFSSLDWRLECLVIILVTTFTST